MKHIVGIADMKVSADADDCLITYALGSCLGITVYDPVATVGGMIHVMLPNSSVNPDKARHNPWMFVDTGVPELFRACYRLGAVKQRLILKVAGGSNRSESETDHFQIGTRNVLMLRKLLWKNGVLIRGMEVGDHLSRTMSIDIATGEVTLRVNSSDSRL